MTWKPISVTLRLGCLVFGAACFGMAWRLTVLGASGAEEVPPPFTLAFGLSAIALLAAALIGRIPLPDSDR